jgi:hypothetical protein
MSKPNETLLNRYKLEVRERQMKGDFSQFLYQDFLERELLSAIRIITKTDKPKYTQ